MYVCVSREQEEDESTNNLMEDYRRSSVASRSSGNLGNSITLVTLSHTHTHTHTHTTADNALKRVVSAPNVRYHKDNVFVSEQERELTESAAHVEKVLLKKKRPRIKSLFGSSK